MVSARLKLLATRLLFERGGIETSEPVSRRELGFSEVDRGYWPTSWRGLRRTFRRIPITEDDVFVDFGSGKGRVILEAGKHRFKRVIGVELAPTLHEVAVRNLALVRPRLRCPQIELVNAHALDFPIPDDLTVAFFFHPFRGEVFATVAQRLAESVGRSPRLLRIVYVNPQEEAALLAHGARRVEWIWGTGEDVPHSIGLYELSGTRR